MKNLKKIFLIAFNLSLIFNCFSSPAAGDISEEISGKVIDTRNFPVPFVKVLIGGKETETDRSGKFRIDKVQSSFTITLAERSSSTAVIYKNISIRNPELILFGKTNPANSNSAIINVKFPEIPFGNSAILKFISTDIFFCEDIELQSGETNKTLLVYWPVEKSSINGNVIYLQKSGSQYEKFQDVAASLYVNPVPFKVTFSGNTKTNTKTSTLNIYLPAKNFSEKGFSVFADFSSYSRNSQILLNEQSGDIFETKSIIPLSLPVSYRLKVAGYADYKDGSGFMSMTYTKPGTTINLRAETPPEIQTPTDKLLGANENTQFYYSLGSGTGVFVVEYHSFFPVMNFYIVTSERSTTLDYLGRDEFKKSQSVEFKWSIRKYLTYFSVNDFVKPVEFNNDVGYKAVLHSSERTFKTGYN